MFCIWHMFCILENLSAIIWIINENFVVLSCFYLIFGHFLAFKLVYNQIIIQEMDIYISILLHFHLHYILVKLYHLNDIILTITEYFGFWTPFLRHLLHYGGHWGILQRNNYINSEPLLSLLIPLHLYYIMSEIRAIPGHHDDDVESWPPYCLIFVSPFTGSHNQIIIWEEVIWYTFCFLSSFITSW